MQKAVLITGASSGIGAATAIEFAKNNYFVYLLGRNEKNLSSIAKQCGKNSKILICDLGEKKQIEKAVSEVTKNKNVKLEILINNAGIYTQHSTEGGSDDIWLSQFQVNLLGPVRLTRALFPYLKKNAGGSIVNVSSTLGLRPSANASAYSAIKAAMVNWTQSMALEGGEHQIRVNCICPGIVDTPIHGFHSLGKAEKKKALDKMNTLQPLQRVGTPEEVAKSIYFLGSDNSSWTTGAILSVDGGINL